MPADSVFENLVASLSREERRTMLERIQQTVNLEAPRPRIDDAEGDLPVDLEAVYQDLPIVRKLFIYVMHLFTGKTREQLVQELLLRRLAGYIRANYPGLVDFRSGTALHKLYERLVAMRNSAQFFSGPIGRAGGKDRAVFLAFLLALEAPTLHESLTLGTNPEHVDADSSEEPDTELRHAMVNTVEEIFDKVDDSLRYSMRQSNRFLDVMGKLSFFPFEKLLKPFTPVGEDGGMQASFLNLREILPDLAPLARSLDVSPSAAALEALILFHQGYQFADTVDDEVMKERLGKAAKHLETLRRVASQVPFLELSRYLRGNVNLTAPPVEGGEEWIALVRRFWRDRAEEAYRRYKYHRQKELLVQDASELTGTHNVTPLREYPAPEEGREGKHALSLAFLRAVLRNTWQQELFPALKVLYIQGEFYKDENRAEFSDAYSTLSKLEDKIDGFRARISMQGDLGRALHDNEEDLSALPVKRRKRMEIISQIDEHAESLVKSAMHAFMTLGKVLNGVLFGEVGGRYDTLSNLGDIEGRHNRRYLDNLEQVMLKMQNTSDTLSRLYDLERAQMETQGSFSVPGRV